MSHVTRPRVIGPTGEQGSTCSFQFGCRFIMVKWQRSRARGPHPEPRGGGGLHNELPLFLCLALVST